MNKRPRDDVEEDSDTKRAKYGAGEYGAGEEADSTVSGRLNAPQAGGSTPGGTGSQVVATIVRNPRIEKISLTFSKRFQLYTGGFRWETFKNNDLFTNSDAREITLLGPDNTTLVTSIGCLNPDLLALYMSPIEFANLPFGAYAHTANIKVTPLGYRLPFATNESKSNYANSQTIVQIMSGVGINTQMPVIEASYVLGTEPTDVANLLSAVPAGSFDGVLYGDTSVHGNAHIGACCGIPQEWNNYISVPIFSADSTGQSLNFPMLTNYFNIQNINDCKGTPIINYSYSTKNGLLKMHRLAWQRRTLARGSDLNFHALEDGFNNSRPVQYNDNGYNNVPSVPPATPHVFARGKQSIQPFTELDYNSRLEKSHWMVRNDGQNITADRPPLCTFGVLPVESGAVLGTTKSYAAVVGLWDVQTSLEVSINMDYINAGSYCLNNAAFDPVTKAIYNGQDKYATPAVYICNKFPIRGQDTVS